MKKVLAFAFLALVLGAAFSLWHSHRAVATLPSSSSQIFIHGTPVCVFTHGQDIVARIGQCPSGFGEENEGALENAPFHGHPDMRLPPGHPPVDRDMVPDDRRRVLI